MSIQFFLNFQRLKNEPGNDHPSFGNLSTNSELSAVAAVSQNSEIRSSSDDKQMYYREASKDITFIVENETIKAHKFILEKKFEAFYSALDSTDDVVELKGVSAKVFRALIKFLYFDKIDVSERLAFGLLEFYDMKLNNIELPRNLKYECEKCLIKMIRKDNAIHYLIRAHELRAEFLEDKALTLIRYNSAELKNTQEYKDLIDDPDLTELAMAILCKQEQ